MKAPTTSLPEFIHTRPFNRVWRELGLSDDRLRLLELAIALSPESGPVVAGTGGLRKTRLALQDGKSGGARVGYASFPEHGVILLIAIFAKADQANFSAEQKSKIKTMLANFDEYLKNR